MVDQKSIKLWEQLGLKEKGTGLIKGSIGDVKCDFVAMMIPDTKSNDTKVFPLLVVVNEDLVKQVKGPNGKKLYNT